MHSVGELSGLQNGIWNSETLPGIQLVPYVLQGKIGTEEQKVDSSLALAHFQAASGIWANRSTFALSTAIVLLPFRMVLATSANMSSDSGRFLLRRSRYLSALLVRDTSDNHGMADVGCQREYGVSSMVATETYS